MHNMAEIRERYMRDELPTRLGGIAANLARVSTFSSNPANKEAVKNLLDESKFFIEWTAGEATVETAAELVELQVQLARWQRRWDDIWEDAPRRMEVSAIARAWSNRVLQASGLLDVG